MAKTRKGPRRLLLPAATAPGRTQSVTPSDASALEVLSGTVAVGSPAASALEALIKELGGRQSCGELLAVAGDDPTASDDPALDTFTQLLLDPRYDRIPLARLCEEARLSIRDFLRAYRIAAIARAQVLATERIASFLPHVVADVMRRAAPYDTVCAVCYGAMTISKGSDDAAPTPCVACHATGRMLVEPDLDRQKLALELGELLKRGGGLSITQQSIQVGEGATGVGGYERMQQALVSALSGPLPPAARPTVTDLAPVEERQDG